MKFLAALLVVVALGGCGDPASAHPPLPVGRWDIAEPEAAARLLLPAWAERIGKEGGYTPSEASVLSALDGYLRSIVMEFRTDGGFYATSFPTLELTGRWRREIDGVYVSADPGTRDRQDSTSRFPVAFRITGESLYARLPEGEVALRRASGRFPGHSAR